MDWHDLEVLIKEERRAGNPVAGSIHSLQLDQNKITLLLSNLLDEEEVRRQKGRLCIQLADLHLAAKQQVHHGPNSIANHGLSLLMSLRCLLQCYQVVLLVHTLSSTAIHVV